MSARAVLRFAAEGDLFTGGDGNPWAEAYSYGAGEASGEITVALWEAGLLRLPERREANGRRRWRLTVTGRLALLASAGGPPGFLPTVGWTTTGLAESVYADFTMTRLDEGGRGMSGEPTDDEWLAYYREHSAWYRLGEACQGLRDAVGKELRPLTTQAHRLLAWVERRLSR